MSAPGAVQQVNLQVSVVSDIIMVYILSTSNNHLFLRCSPQIGLTPGLNKVSNVSSAAPVSRVCSVSQQPQCESRRQAPIGRRQTLVVAWWTSTLPTPAENAESFYAFPAFSRMLHWLHCSNFFHLGVEVPQIAQPAAGHNVLHPES